MKQTNIQIDRERQAFLKGYRKGYTEGLADGHAGKSGLPDLPDLPVEALGLPTRTANSLIEYGCTCVADVARLSTETILYLRGMGKKVLTP